VPGLAQYEVGGWQYFGQDRLGSVRTLLNPAGELLLARNYDPFGNVLVQGGVGSSGFGYAGEQVDSTGLVYLRARYYHPVVGRFLTPDSIVPNPVGSQGWNGYAYTENNPIRYTDPSGHRSCLQTAILHEGGIGTGGIDDCLEGGIGGSSFIRQLGGPAGALLGYALKEAVEGYIEGGMTPVDPELLKIPPTSLDGNLCSDPKLGGTPVDTGIFEPIPFPLRQPTIEDIITADPFEPVEVPFIYQATLDDILQDTVPGPDTKGRSVNRLKYGGYDDALSDFLSLDDLSIIGTYPGGVIVGELPNGIKVNVRTGSTFGGPTLEIQMGKRSIKIRYIGE
jgi:RHS repeat-associated protein